MSKMSTSSSEVRLGSITLFHEPEPELPELAEQARVVAEFTLAVYQHNLFSRSIDPQVLDKYRRLGEGDLTAAYTQHTAEEVEEEKKRIVMYDEVLMDRLLLPVEEQLTLDFYNARAQLWAVEHGDFLSWAAWDKIRKLSKIKQGTTGDLLKQKTVSGSTSASQRAHAAVRQALEKPGREISEVNALETAVLKDMFVLGRIALPIHDSLPRQLPERIPNWAWQSGLYLLCHGWWELENTSVLPQLPSNLMPVFSAKPMLMTDRALRGHRMWNIGPIIEYTERATPGISLQYYSKELNSEQLQAMLKRLDPRTSDVWRLVLAKALEEGGTQTYTPIKLTTRELARALGYAEHKKGGMKPEHQREVAEALEHIERLHIQVTPEAEETREFDRGQKRRKSQTGDKVRYERVLAIMSKTGQRDLFGHTYFTEWEVALGSWARYFDRSFAPIFRTLVQLPGRGSTNIWAKQIGTELAYYYRQDRQPDPSDPARRRPLKRLKVRTLLERACLMPEFEDMWAARNHRRAVNYFEKAMDLLKEHEVHAGWVYDTDEEKALSALEGKPGWVEAWLDCNVEITAPDYILAVLPRPTVKTLKG